MMFQYCIPSQMRSEFRSELHSELYSELHSELHRELHSELRSGLHNELHSYDILCLNLCGKMSLSVSRQFSVHITVDNFSSCIFDMYPDGSRPFRSFCEAALWVWASSGGVGDFCQFLIRSARPQSI